MQNFSSTDANATNALIFKVVLTKMSTVVEHTVACAPISQRARVRSPVGTTFLGEVFSGFFLICNTNIRKL